MAKGQYRTIEAVIAVISLISFLFFLSKVKPTPVEFKSLDVKLRMQKALEALYLNGTLRKLVYSGDTNAILNALYPYLLKNYNYRVCIGSCNFTGSGEIYSVSYYLATNGTFYNPKEVTIYAWE